MTANNLKLPAGWTESAPGRMATNNDPVNGGIIDQNYSGHGWFVIFHRDDLDSVEGLASRDEAFIVFAEKMHGNVCAGEASPLTVKALAYEELAQAACSHYDAAYDVNEDEAMLGFDVVGTIND